MQVHQINNAVYESLGELWYQGADHVIALLRAEASIKIDYILGVLQTHHFKPDTTSVLDIGCGGGLLANPLAARGYRVLGIDQAGDALQTARRHAPCQGNIRYEQASAYALPQGEAFDVILLMDVLEHLNHPQAAIQEARRHLKPGGLIFFHTFNRTFLANLLAIKALEWLFRDCPEDLHVFQYFIRPAELTKIFQNVGLAATEFQGIRPVFSSFAFLNSILRRQVHPNFAFRLTRSLAVGYLGYAQV